jgi:hypothetical protein
MARGSQTRNKKNSANKNRRVTEGGVRHGGGGHQTKRTPRLKTASESPRRAA